MAAAAAIAASRNIKARLRADPSFRAYGAFCMSASPCIAELMGNSGFGFLVVDCEHAPTETETAFAMLQAIRASGTPALLRVPVNRPEIIKKALDLGPDGLIVPLVDSPEEAKAAVAACRYPPRGIRGVAPRLVRASGWGSDKSYLEAPEDGMLLLCQVETVGAFESVEQILSVDGLDGIFVGPADLSATLGFFGQPKHPKVLEAMAKIEAAAAKFPSKVLSGYMGSRTTEEMFAAGYRLVTGTTDVGLLKEAALANVQEAAEAETKAKKARTS